MKTVLRPTFEIRLSFAGHLGGHWFELTAIETAPATPGVDVLAGQDILAKINMHYHGPQKTLILMY